MALFTKRNAAKFGRRGGIAARAVSGKRTGRKAAGKIRRASQFGSTANGRRQRYVSGSHSDRRYGQPPRRR